MNSKRKILERKRRKRRIQQVVHLLLPFYLLCLIGSQLTTPTSASFTDVTTIVGTLSLENDFGEEEQVDAFREDEDLPENGVVDEKVEPDSKQEKKELDEIPHAEINEEKEQEIADEDSEEELEDRGEENFEQDEELDVDDELDEHNVTELDSEEH
ncbi:SipW-dependent-type signal peptide-containing protein [Bacillus sp. SD088]|uniref:SipW-dependent-type signal peptide-containing protein n=1 Tax=Bacillus sp. SD088 TaxID=2782012 RepID=UPI001A97C3FC|nr:SipW-dependent-type signal peptide-containing protein [Bacillus sp. SD088]MBO0995838.1 hypothetical protein [Bacillus sp. SD088]